MGGRRSAFVDGVAWVFIALSSAKLLLYAVQAALTASLEAPLRGLVEALAAAPSEPRYPAWARLLSSQGPLLLRLGCAFSGAKLVSAIGLLKRREWAREALVLLLCLSALRSALRVLLQGMLLASASFPRMESDALRLLMFSVAMTLLVSSALMAFLLLWIASRLASPEVRGEFRGASEPAPTRD